MATSSATVDTLIIGGGIQGLTLLNEMVSRGFSTALVTNSDLGEGQTLHSHGLINISYFFPGKKLRDSLSNDWLPFAGRHGLSIYGNEASYVLIPPDFFQQLRQGWDAFGYPYQEIAGDVVPAPIRDCELLRSSVQTHVLKIEEYKYPKRQLIRALSDGLTDRVIRGDITGFRCSTDGKSVRLESVNVLCHSAGDRVTIAPRLVIFAAGTGTKRLFRSLVAADSFEGAASRIGDGEKVREAMLGQISQITYRPMHMLCVRGPQGALPAISVAAMVYGLLVIGHQNNAHSRAANDASDYVSWYVTPRGANMPPSVEDVPHNAQAPIDRELVSRGLGQLLKVFPFLKAEAEKPGSLIQFCVYAGYKQDIGDAQGVAMCERANGLGNVIVTAPSVATNAWSNARNAAAMVAEQVRQGAAQPKLPHGGQGVKVGDVNEHTDEVQWMSLDEFSRAYSPLASS